MLRLLGSAQYRYLLLTRFLCLGGILPRFSLRYLYPHLLVHARASSPLAKKLVGAYLHTHILISIVLRFRVILGHVVRRGTYPWQAPKHAFVYDRQDLALLEMNTRHDVKHVIPLAKIKLISKQVCRRLYVRRHCRQESCACRFAGKPWEGISVLSSVVSCTCSRAILALRLSRRKESSWCTWTWATRLWRLGTSGYAQIGSGPSSWPRGYALRLSSSFFARVDAD